MLTTPDGHLNPDFKMKDSPRVWTGLLPHLETNPNQDSLYPFGSSWRKGMMRMKTQKKMMRL